MPTFTAEETREHRTGLIDALRTGYPRKNEGKCFPTVVDGVYDPHGYTLAGFIWKTLGTHSQENFDRQASYLVEKCMNYYGFSTEAGTYTDPETGAKRQLFMDHSLSFAQAADVIEAEPAGLFDGNERIPQWRWDVDQNDVLTRESSRSLDRLEKTGERLFQCQISETQDGYQLVTTITKTQVVDSLESALTKARESGGDNHHRNRFARMRHILKYPDGREEVVVTW